MGSKNQTHCFTGHEFSEDNTLYDKYGGRRCKACAYHRTRVSDQKLDPAVRKIRRRGYQIKSLYKLTPEAHKELLDNQKRTCANPGCDSVENAGEPLHIDHDHACCNNVRRICGKCIRGLLCKKCNLILGLAEDNTKQLRGLSEYIESWKQYSTVSSTSATTPPTKD